jgi:hypothetical protein
MHLLVMLELLLAILPQLDAERLILSQTGRSSNLCERYKVLKVKKVINNLF